MGGPWGVGCKASGVGRGAQSAEHRVKGVGRAARGAGSGVRCILH